MYQFGRSSFIAITDRSVASLRVCVSFLKAWFKHQDNTKGFASSHLILCTFKESVLIINKNGLLHTLYKKKYIGVHYSNAKQLNK